MINPKLSSVSAKNPSFLVLDLIKLQIVKKVHLVVSSLIFLILL